MRNPWSTKWCSLRAAAKKKGVKCSLTLDEYIQLANEAGIVVEQIGKSIDSYQLGRYGDKGNYELGNCRFITMRQNLDERKLNGGNQTHEGYEERNSLLYSRDGRQT